MDKTIADPKQLKERKYSDEMLQQGDDLPAKQEMNNYIKSINELADNCMQTPRDDDHIESTIKPGQEYMVDPRVKEILEDFTNVEDKFGYFQQHNTEDLCRQETLCKMERDKIMRIVKKIDLLIQGTSNCIIIKKRTMNSSGICVFFIKKRFL